jgi:imidazolonepropionase-like amidohydrolase
VSHWSKAATVAVAALVAGCAGGGGSGPSGDLLLRADRIFDGTRMLGDGAVLVRGSKVVAVGASDAEATRTIDLGDATLLPGFIDLHVHQFGEGMLAGGVTTVRDLGVPIAFLPPPRARPGALRILAAGPLVTVPGGYPTPVHGPAVALNVRGPEGARRAVRMLAARGAAVVKVSLEPGPGWPMLSPAELDALVEEAHARGLKVVAHAQAEGVRLALDGGVDELAHMPCGPTDATVMRSLARRGIEIVGTLHVLEQFCGTDALLNARAFVEAGGTLLYGSDYGVSGIPGGIDVEELRLMVSAGLSRREAIVNATSRAAEQLPVDGLGVLREGGPADVVAVRGDPLADLGVLASPVLVVVRGAVVVDGPRLNLPPPP